MEENMAAQEETRAAGTAQEMTPEQEAEFLNEFGGEEETPSESEQGTQENLEDGDAGRSPGIPGEESDPGCGESPEGEQPSQEGETAAGSADGKGGTDMLNKQAGEADFPDGRGVREPSEAELFIQRMAQNAGVTPEEFMRTTLETVGEQKIAARVQQLLDQGVEEEMARHIAQLETEVSRYKAGEETRQNEQQEKQARYDRFMESVRRLEETYPEAKEWTEFPDGMRERMSKGMLPLEAYQATKLAGVMEMEKELKQLRQEKKNRETSAGSVKGAKVEADDEFIRVMDKYM